MICPLTSTILRTNGFGEESYGLTCVEEDCAWWDETKGQCCLKTLAQEVQRLNNCVKVKK